MKHCGRPGSAWSDRFIGTTASIIHSLTQLRMKTGKALSASYLLRRFMLIVLFFIIVRESSERILFEVVEPLSPVVSILLDLSFLLFFLFIFIYRDIRAHMPAEEKLKESDILFNKFISYSPIYTYIKEVTQDGSITLYCSDNFIDMTGLSSESMIGKRMDEVFPKEFADKITADDREVIRSGTVVRLEERLSGKIYSTLKYPIILGKRAFIAGYTIDISDIQRTADELKESEGKYRALVEESPDAIAIHVNGKIVYINKACLTLMRATSESDLMGKSVMEFIHPDYLEVVVQRMRQSVREGKALPIMHEQFIRLDGTMVDVEVKSIPIVYEQTPAVQLIVRDITERKRAQDELEESREKYRGLSDAAFESIFLSERGVCIEQNAMAEKMFGYTSEEAIGRLGIEWIVPEDRDMVMKNILSGFDLPYEATALRKDGTTFPCTLHGKMMKYLGREVRVTSLRDNTETMRALRALKESEGMLKASQEASGIGSYIFDIGRSSWFSSERLALMLGLPPDVVHPIEDWLEVIHAEDRPAVTRHFTEDVLGKRQRFNIEYRIINRLTGEERWVHGIGELESDAGGNPQRLLGTIQDITERKQAEEYLRESENKYRSLVENIDIGVVAHAPDTQIIFCNERAEQLLGLTKDQMMGKTAIDPVWHFIRENGERLPVEDYPVHQVLRSERSMQEQVLGVIMPDSDGPKWMQCNAHKVCDQTGAVRQAVVTFFDVTFRRNAERTLRESELRFKKILQDVQTVAVQGYAPDGTVQYWNRASERLYGYTEQEAIGRNLLDLIIPDEMQQPVRDAMTMMAKTGEPIPASELSLVRKDGTRVTVFSSHTIVRITGRPQELFCIDIDITERKQAEESLRHSQKLESIGTLAGGIAHDFNNLLVAILGQSSLALSKLPKESPVADNISKAIKASERAASLTRQLLAYSGKGKLFPVEFELNVLVKDNVQILELSVPKNAQMIFDLFPHPLTMKGDIGQIQQVIMNLIINAGEAIGPEQGTITIRTSEISITQSNMEYWGIGDQPLAPGTYALLQVIDTGCGISKETLSRIFDPFFTTKFTGRGLGLAAVLGIIRGHFGGIHIQSEEGKGSRFEVVLPVQNIQQLPAEPKKTVRTYLPGEKRTILVIDDDHSVIELVQDIFSDTQFTMIGTVDPWEGIEFYQKHSDEISMVILDYSMPRMNGKAAFERLHALNPNVKVLLCSGYSEDETFSTFDRIRPERFFQK
ncbi:MAG: PAS domain S-box protein, partial [Bacteroidota bacterium]